MALDVARSSGKHHGLQRGLTLGVACRRSIGATLTHRARIQKVDAHDPPTGGPAAERAAASFDLRELRHARPLSAR